MPSFPSLRRISCRERYASGVALPRAATPRARSTALVLLGALALHQLRYLLFYGAGAPRALAHQGHGYLTDVLPAVAVVAMAMIAGSLLTAAAVRSTRSRPSGSLKRMTPLFALSLLAIFSIQEVTEGALSAGHASGLGAVLAGGGWIALPLALALGAVCAVAARVLDRTERALTVRLRTRRGRSRHPVVLASATPSARAPLASLALAFGFARRPPPLLSVG
jgi:hypothetical protein